MPESQRQAGERQEETAEGPSLLGRAAVVAEAAPVLLAYVDGEERYRYVNPAYAEWCGLLPDQVVGRRLVEVLGEAGYAAVRVAASQALAGRHVQFASELVRRDGEARQVEVTYVPHTLPDGTTVGFVAHVVDCTLEHFVEAQQQQAQARQRFLVQAGELLAGSLEVEATLAALARLAVPVLGDGCRVDLVQPGGGFQMVVVHHHDAHKLEVARALVERFPVTPEGRESSVARVLRTGEPVWVPELTDAVVEAAARGPEHLALLRASDLRSQVAVPLKARGRVLGALSFWTNGPTRRFGAEDVAFAQDLARQAALAVDNALLHQESVRAAELRELLLAAVSHDLRSPLSAISMCGAALQRQHALPEPALQAVGIITASAERMRQMLGSLLDFSRVRSGTLVLERRAVDLQPVVQRAVEEVLLVHPERAVALACEGPVWGDFDAGAVARVVSNLVGNAVLYSPAPEPVWVELRGTGEAAVLVVHNRGAPIPPELLPHLFEPFRRGEGGGRGGLGLGLYIVRELAAAHGGRVEVSSTGEDGTRFTVTLPRAAR